MQETAAKAFPIERVRSQFPLLQTEMNGKPLVFLDSAASSQKPQQVLDAIEHYYDHDNANVHRGGYALSQRATDAFEAARTTMAKSTTVILFLGKCCVHVPEPN